MSRYYSVLVITVVIINGLHCTCVGCSVRQSVDAEMLLLSLLLLPVLFGLDAFTADCVVSRTDDDDEVMLNVLRSQLTY